MSSKRSSIYEKTDNRRDSTGSDFKRTNQLVIEGEKRSKGNSDHNLIEHSKRYGLFTSESSKKRPLDGSGQTSNASESSPIMGPKKSSIGSPPDFRGHASANNRFNHASTKSIDSDVSDSNDSNEEVEVADSIGRWTRHEHEQFLKGLRSVGKNWQVIAGEYVTTRTEQQIRTHAAGYFEKIAKLPVMGGLGGVRRSTNNADSVAKSTMLLNNSADSGNLTPLENLMEAAEKVPLAMDPSHPFRHLPPGMFPPHITALSRAEIVAPLQLSADPAAQSGISFPSSAAAQHYNQYMLSIASQYYQMAAMYQPTATIPPPLAAAPPPAVLMGTPFPFGGSVARPAAVPSVSTLSKSPSAPIARMSTERTGGFNAPPLQPVPQALPQSVLHPVPQVVSQPLQQLSMVRPIHQPHVTTFEDDVEDRPLAIPPSVTNGNTFSALSGPLLLQQQRKAPLIPNLDQIITAAVSAALKQYLPLMADNPASALQHGSFTHGGGKEKMNIQFASSVPDISKYMDSGGNPIVPIDLLSSSSSSSSSFMTGPTPAVPVAALTAAECNMPSILAASSSSMPSRTAVAKRKQEVQEEDDENDSDNQVDEEQDQHNGSDNEDDGNQDDEVNGDDDGEEAEAEVVKYPKPGGRRNNKLASENGTRGGPKRKQPKSPEELAEWKENQRKKQAETLAQERAKRLRTLEKAQQKEQQRMVRMMLTGAIPTTLTPAELRAHYQQLQFHEVAQHNQYRQERLQQQQQQQQQQKKQP